MGIYLVTLGVDAIHDLYVRTVPSNRSFSKNSNHTPHPCTKISVFVVRTKKLYFLGNPKYAPSEDSDLNIRCVYMYEGTFSDIVAHRTLPMVITLSDVSSGISAKS